jgi:hypothetical protein
MVKSFNFKEVNKENMEELLDSHREKLVSKDLRQL